jgi:AraC-like DNA-binding protein
MRRFFGDGHPLKAVHVTHPAPAYHAEYRRVFQAPVVFESEANALVFDAARWPRRIGTEPTYVSRILGAHADRLLRDLEQSKTARGRVERALLARLRRGETGMDAVAAELGLSRKTLARRLKAEGVTFASVLDDLRRTVAVECLLDAGLSVKETAYLVGYSEPAPFSRAFKRWTGLSPRAYVARAREDRR